MAQQIIASVDPAGRAFALANLSVPDGFVRLSCPDPKLDVLVRMGDGSPHYSGGFGGWEVIARPRQVGMTIWQGVEPLTLELALLFDGFPNNQSQEHVLRDLYAVARGDDESPPGVLRVVGIPLAADRWVIESIDVGDALLRSKDRARIRQALTLTLREYVPPTYVQLRRSALAGSKGKTTTITVRKGDTPASIAHRRRCSWTELRDANVGVVTKANQNLKDGTKLRVPVATTRKRRAEGSPRSRKSTSSKRAN